LTQLYLISKDFQNASNRDQRLAFVWEFKFWLQWNSSSIISNRRHRKNLK